MKEAALLVFVVLSIVLFGLTNIHLMEAQQGLSSSLQTVKIQLEWSERGIVSIPEPNYRLVVVLSIISFVSGTGAGWLLFRKS